jgi:hypothetical protein
VAPFSTVASPARVAATVRAASTGFSDVAAEFSVAVVVDVDEPSSTTRPVVDEEAVVVDVPSIGLSVADAAESPAAASRIAAPDFSASEPAVPAAVAVREPVASHW